MRRVLFTLLLLAVVAVAGAQSTGSQAEVDALKERIAKLEKRSEVWDKLKPAFQISGYLQAGYDLLWGDDGETTTSSFHLRRARMTLQGDIYNGKAGKANYRIQVDLCKSPVIMDLWVKYQPVNEFGAQIGQFKLPISIENTDYNATKLEFITYANTVQRMSRNGSVDMTGINSSGRDIGLQFAGGFIERQDFDIINYEVGVFNGSGINVKDSNLSKDVAARLTIQPLKLLKIAAYGLFGEIDATSLASKYPGMIQQNKSANVRYLRYNRFGGGFDYNDKNIFGRAEFIGGQTGDYTSAGVYGQVGYKLRDKFTVGVRYDYFVEDLNDEAPELTTYSVAVSYRPWKHIRLQAEYSLQETLYKDVTKLGNCLYFMATALF